MQNPNPQNDLKYQKYIRGYAMPPSESGMNLNNDKNIDQHYNQYMNKHIPPNMENQYNTYPHMENQYSSPYIENQYDQTNYNHATTPYQYTNYYNQNNQNYQGDENVEKFKLRESDTLNCRDVAHHTSNCPVCSKLYKNDKTIYWVIIIILVIICILLFNKVLDNKFHH